MSTTITNITVRRAAPASTTSTASTASETKINTDYVLSFIDNGTACGWPLVLSVAEASALEIEVKHYNEWIKMLFAGLAPSSSYRDDDDEQYYLAHAQKEYGTLCSEDGPFTRPSNRAYYENSTGFFFTLDKLTDVDDDSFENEPLRTLHDIITNPFGGEEFGMGYKLLPMTRHVIERTLGLEARLLMTSGL
jgi:hypothetical protein